MPTKMRECTRCQVLYPDGQQHSCVDAVAPDPREEKVLMETYVCPRCGIKFSGREFHSCGVEPVHSPPIDEAPKALGLSLPDIAPQDNWQHRAENMRCRTCMWYVPKSEKLGRCRFNAPTIKGWPAMFPGDWCGQHKLDEGKI